MRRALAIDEKSYGADHPDVATDLNNLAQLLQDTNRLAEAENHPAVALCLNNLATLMKETNRVAEAEPLMRRALAITEKSYGEDHPDVALRLNNLATLMKETNRAAEAEPLMRRALATLLKFTRMTGHIHPRLRAAFRNYYGFFSEMSFPEEHFVRQCLKLLTDAGFDAETSLDLLKQLLESKS